MLAISERSVWEDALTIALTNSPLRILFYQIGLDLLAEGRCSAEDGERQDRTPACQCKTPCRHHHLRDVVVRVFLSRLSFKSFYGRLNAGLH